MHWSLQILIFCTSAYSYETIHLNDAAYINSPGFPNGYANLTMANGLYKITTDDGYGMVFLFNRFAIGPADCLLFCPDNSDDCLRKTGLELQYPFFYYPKNSVSILLESANPKRMYAGFQAQVRKIDPMSTSKSYFQCNSTVDMSSETGPFFIVSENYQTSQSSYLGKCNVAFTAKNPNTGMRIVVSQFESEANNSQIILDGNSESGKAAHISISNVDGPTAYYFKGDVQFSFSSTTKSYSFFVKVEKYDISQPTSNCLDTGTFTVTNETTIRSQKDSGSYGSNQDCRWKYTNLPENSQFAIELEFDSEACCDVLTLGGSVENGPGAVQLKGHYEYLFRFSSQKELNFEFTTDALEQYVGFNGTVHTLDCKCEQNRNIVDDNIAISVTSPGYGTNQITYCQNIQCTTVITYPRTSLLHRVTSVTDLYPNDTVRFESFDGSLKQINDQSYDGNGAVRVTFLSNDLSKTDNIKSRHDLATGFSHTFGSTPLNINYFNIDLCEVSFSSFSSLSINNPYNAVVYQFSSNKCNSQITLFPFHTAVLEKYYSVSIFDGDLLNGNPVNFPAFERATKLANFTVESKIATVKIVKLPNPNHGISPEMETFGIVKAVGNGDCVSVRVALEPTAMGLSSQGECSHVFYYYFESISKFSGVSFKYEENTNIKMYKGISTDESHLVTGSNGEQPSFIYGPFFTVRASNATRPFVINVNGAYRSDFVLTTTSSPDIITTFDYATEFLDNRAGVYQEITLVNTNTNTTVVQMLKALVQTETLQVKTIVNDKTVKLKSYKSSDDKFTIEERADQLILTYSSQDVYSNGGLLAMVTQRGTPKPQSTTPSTQYSHLPQSFKSFIVVLMLLIC